MSSNKKGEDSLESSPLSCVLWLQGVSALPLMELAYCPDVAALAEVAPAPFGMLR